MKPIRELTDLLSRLPGLGPRQARRVVQYLLAHDQTFRHTLATLIDTVNLKTAQCASCGRFDDVAQDGLCNMCADMARDKTTLIVVEHDVDIDAIEASLTYHGSYVVLGGLYSLTKSKTRKGVPEPRTKALLDRVTSGVAEGLVEVIFALSATPEGDFTAKELAHQIQKLHPGIKITLLGRGLSIGAELEYADPETVRNALKNRN